MSEPVPKERGGTPDEEARNRAELERTWAEPTGWRRLGAVSHKTIATRYLITALVFFLLGGLEAAAMRAQLARPESRILSPDLYNQIFTMHGTTMMFLFAVPIMEAMGVWLVPLMIGTRNVAFPRMNAFGYWVFLIGGLLLYGSFLVNMGPDAGWFAYVPLSGPQFSPGKRVDVWAQMITFTEISALVVAVELIVTILKMRAPGMALHRMPLFVWAMLVTSFMVVFAMPAVMVASGLLAMDRLIGTQFFNLAEGGDPLLWQHLFWFFGHPEVYIIFVPALGMVSAIVNTFTRRRIFGNTGMVLSLVATGFIGFGLWVHHMFATDLPQLGQSFFTAASIMIALPTGVQIFCWIATLWGSRPRLAVPLLWVLGFVAVFVVGGLTGVMLAAVPFDLQVHDTFFVVAHFHYVLIGGAVFPLLGALHYWFPKFTGRMAGEGMGKVAFWLTFVGFNVAFFPMHLLGFRGMPRRVWTYGVDRDWGGLNLLSSLGAVVLVAGLLVFAANLLKSRRTGARAGANPWGASTLEWAVSSPPPVYNFEHLPVVDGSQPLWRRDEVLPVVWGLRGAGHREILVTRPIDATPDHRFDLPGPSLWPLALALAVGVAFICGIFTAWAIPAAMVLSTVALVGWFWPRGSQPLEEVEDARDEARERER
jgi:cytochrome c oxidase subunit I+III